MKHKVQDRIDATTSQAEAIVATNLMKDFSRDLFLQFKQRKDNIENWQKVSTNISALKSRLRTVADKNDWTVDNLLDMALICAIIWNDTN